MLLPVPPKSRRRRRRRVKPSPAPALPPVSDVTVLAATVASIYEVDFSFSSAVTSVGGAGNEQIVLTTFIGEETPSMATQVNATTVRFRFDGGAIEAGLPWSIASVPDGLDFHGATFVVPQDGTVAAAAA